MELTARYNIDDTTVRFDYQTCQGEPPRSIVLEGVRWHRRSYLTLSYDPTTGLVWYERYRGFRD